MRTQSATKSLILAAIAFALAGIAQGIFGGLLKISNPVPYGWLLYGIAVVLFIMAFGRTVVSQFALGRLSDLPETRLRFSRLQGTLFALSIALSLFTLMLFSKPENASWAWILHVISVLLVIAAFLRFESSHSATAKPTSFGGKALAALPIIAVMVLAVFARLWQLSEFPFGSWLDESINGLAALQILEDPNYRPIFVDTMPSHFIYLISLAFSLFGNTPFALRLVTAALGIFGVLFAYLLFRRWFGMTMGVVAAGVLAVMRYHLTYSRFGVNAISVPAFELAALYFLDRALTEKKAADFAWLGMTLGFGLSFYTAFRLFPIVLAVFLLALLIAAIAKYGWTGAFGRYFRTLFPYWLITALTLVIVLMPVVQFAWQHRQDFFARTSTVSIFQHRDEPDLGKALVNNTRKHLEMFNVTGDGNGRHNLPGAPMLDPIMGVLFVLGAGYALWRWRDLTNLLMLLVFLVMIQSGVLSLDFEAPQSLRAIGVIPALVYFISLPLAAVAKSISTILDAKAENVPDPEEMAPVSSPASHFRVWHLGFVALLVLLTYVNFNIFFNKQKNDPSAWAQHSAAETLVAKRLKEQSGQYDFVVAAMYDNHPTVRFLSDDRMNYQRWTVTDRFPLVRDPGRGVILLFDETLLPAYHDIQRIYPNAKLIEHHAPTGGGTVLYEAVLTPEDLQAANGVMVSYYNGNTVEGEPEKVETVQQAALDWTASQPTAEPFTAQLRSTLFASEYGSYRFRIQDAPGAKLWIDEYPVTEAPITLARATHSLRLEIPGNVDTLELLWQPPSSPELQSIPSANLFLPNLTNSGLLGAYYPTPDWSGEPAFTQIDPQIAFYFHIIPLPRPYTVAWTGKLFAPESGEYKFTLTSVDGSNLMIDNQLVVDNPDGNATAENTTTLTEGWHDINVRFSDKTGGTKIYLYWTPPGAGEPELIPPKFLSPPMGQYPTPDQVQN